MRAHLLLAALLGGCTAPKDAPEPGGDTGAGEPVDRDPFNIATFNIDWLSPRVADPDDWAPRNTIDHQLLHSLIEDHALDLVALQEIEGQAALDVLRFEDPWASVVGDSGWSQNLAILYRSDVFTVDDVREVQLPGTDWPDRYPLVATVRHASGLTFTLVVVHHAAYADAPSAAYRQNQARELRGWLDTGLPEQVPTQLAQSVVVMGDFNDDFEPLNPDYPSLDLIEAGGAWRFATRQAEAASSIGYGSLIDHIVLSADMVGRWPEQAAARSARVIQHDTLEPWASYSGGYGNDQNLSSHRPVWITLDAAR